MSILERFKGAKAAVVGRSLFDAEKLAAVNRTEAAAARAAVVNAAVADREATIADLHTQDVAEVSAERARIAVDLSRVDLLADDAGAEIAEAVENFVAALAAFDAGLSNKLASVTALEDRARELATHLRTEHGVNVTGAGTAEAHLHAEESAAWRRACAGIREVADRAFATHGLGNAHRAKAILDNIGAAMNRIEAQVRAKRIAASAPR